MLKKLKDIKKNKKGFTLVELIVVLVILAILIALLMPALTGYIDKANEKKIAVKARAVFTAAQTLSSEEYAANPTTKVFVGQTVIALTAKPAGSNQTLGGLAEVNAGTISIVIDDKGKITSMTYTDGGYTATYTGPTGTTDGSWAIKATTTS